MLTKTAVLVYHKCHLASSHYLSFRLFAPAGQKSTSLLRGRQGGYRRKATDSTWDEKHHSRIDGNAITGRGYNPSVFLPRRGKKPAPLTQGSREVRSVRLGEHRGAEIRAQYPHSKAKKYSLPPALPEGGYIFIYSCAKSFLNLSSFSASSM